MAVRRPTTTTTANAARAKRTERTERTGRTERAAPASSAPGATSSASAPSPRVDIVAAALAEARSVTRSDAAEGSEPIVTNAVAARVDEAFRNAAPGVRAKLSAMLVELTVPTQRALLLKAIAARANALAHDAEPPALDVLAKFAARIATMSRAELIVRATALDLDSTRNTSTFDPQGLWEKRGTISDRGAGDVAADNDGLFQRFSASCGPTTLQMALAEADPVFAFALHDESRGGITSDATDDAVARFQRALLEAHGGKALGRRESHLRARYRNALARYGTLEAVREKYAGFPTDAELARIHSEKWPERDEGIGTDAMLALLDEHLTPLTGIRYRPVEFARGGASRHFDDVARALRQGVDVAFGISEPGHWMLLSAVDGRKPNRRFLVSDPDGGRTAWVDERSFARGKFADDQFHLPKGAERPYVDSFFLPEGT